MGWAAWLLGLFVVCSARAAFAADAPVEFRREIWPLLQRRCVTCHGPLKVQGALRLDTRAGAEQGGQSGQNLLHEPAAGNELLRRISAAAGDERMPPEGEPLTATETDLLTRWIQAGASWPDELPAPAMPPRAAPPMPWFDRMWQLVDSTRSAWYAGLVSMICLLLLQRARERIARESASAAASPAFARLLAKIPRSTAVVGFLLSGLWGLILLLSQTHTELARLQALRIVPSPTAPSADPEQIAAKHPPRLGGEYYRGNDERNPRLFNGGFYRTATLGVHLVDEDGRPCAWNDTYPDQPRIAVTIERAPQATPSLFTEKIMSRTFLAPALADDPSAGSPHEPQMLAVVTPGEKWEVHYDLPSCSASNHLRGRLFLYSDLVMSNGRTLGTPHYRIEYDLQIDAGQIASGSRLEMTSAYQPGNVARLAPGTILPDEWFDFRPIPVIEGEQTTDPELLGILEHVEKGRVEPTE